MTDLGTRIQSLRKQANLTQSGLAEKVGISHTQMARYETKNMQPSANVLKKLADIFDVSIDYLVNGNKSEKAAETLNDAELIKYFKQLDKLPDDEKKSILKVIGALIRDFNIRQSYIL
jgi:transcriptional regulator with XRE-family HTH domain